MNPETFPHQAALLEYAEAHDLVYAWEGTRSFEKRSRTLSPEQFQIVTVHTRRQSRNDCLIGYSINLVPGYADSRNLVVSGSSPR